MGDVLMPVPTRDEYERMKFQHREAALMRNLKNQIEQANKQRWL
jgi:hypothetical protein